MFHFGDPFVVDRAQFKRTINTNKIELKVGDRVQGVKWHSHYDSSYVGDIMEILAFDPCTFMFVTKGMFGKNKLVDQNRFEVKLISSKFEEECIKLGVIV